MKVLYRIYDAENNCLYIGCTSNIKTRLYQHKRESDWMGYAAKIEVDEYPDKMAPIAELALIEAIRPLFNRKGVYEDSWYGCPYEYMRSKGHNKFRSNGSYF